MLNSVVASLPPQISSTCLPPGCLDRNEETLRTSPLTTIWKMKSTWKTIEIYRLVGREGIKLYPAVGLGSVLGDLLHGVAEQIWDFEKSKKKMMFGFPHFTSSCHRRRPEQPKRKRARYRGDSERLECGSCWLIANLRKEVVSHVRSWVPVTRTALNRAKWKLFSRLISISSVLHVCCARH